MGYKLMREARRRKLPMNLKAVWLAMADHASDKTADGVWASQETLAWEIGGTGRFVRLAQRQLEKIGAIVETRKPGRRTPRQYRINLDAVPIDERSLRPEQYADLDDNQDRNSIPPLTNQDRNNTSLRPEQYSAKPSYNPKEDTTKPNGSTALPHSKKRKLPSPDPVALAAQHQRCQDCSVNMERQLTLDAGEDWLCPNCGLRCPIVNIGISDTDLAAIGSDPSATYKRKQKEEDRSTISPTVENVIRRINELAGTAYKPESKIVRDGLMRRLKDGATESDCITVVEAQWREWKDDAKMRKSIPKRSFVNPTSTSI